MIIKPPQRPLQFLRWFCREDYLDEIEGDLLEIYRTEVENSPRKAKWKFTWSVIKYFRPEFMKSFENYYKLNSYSMLQNYFKVGIRNILKYKVFSFINVFGLAVAMSICMLIILMLSDQNRYDQFHEKKDRIYRILSSTPAGRQAYASSPYPLAAALKAEYPIIEETTRLTPGVGGDAMYNQHIADMRGYFADPSFFKVFSFELESGDKESALKEPNSVIISSEMATRLFNNEDPIGKVIEFADRQLPFPQRHDGVGAPPVSWGSFTVTGVIDETKYLSHLKFDALVSSSTRESLYVEKKLEDLTSNWEWYYRGYTFVLLPSDKTVDDLNAALNDLVAHKYADLKAEQVKGFHLEAQSLGDVQLGLMSNDTNNRLPLIGYYFLIILAAIIMITACLNYTNLSVARALTRAKEIGVRKVTGANKNSLVYQFLSESIITSLLAMAMAILLLFLIKPAFMNLWVNKYLEFQLPSTAGVYLYFIAFAIAIGILAGLYPAFHLSKYQPIKALKNLNNTQPGKLGMRKVLSVSQFVISLFFITTSILVFNQFKHFMSFDYGFASKNIVNIELQGMNYQKLANELSAVAGVSDISASDIIPATGTSNGFQIKRPDDKEEYVNTSILLTDEHFTDNLGLKIIAGRNLPSVIDSLNRFILINEEATRKLGFQYPADAVGQVFETKWGKESVEVIGVVQNFRYKMLINQHEIQPLVLRNQPSKFQYLNVKVSSNDLMATVNQLETVWKKIDPIHPFKYEFFDEQLAATHKGIFDLVSILGFIAFLAIVIACLGLLGMAIYTSERRAKEVGIRKVMGAGERSIALLLSKEFFKMIIISIVIGAPFSYFVNNFWLQYFPNRVEFGVGTLLSGIIVLLILGLLTIGSQTLRAAKNNPVDALKSE
jgi:putative ABC transport system permease protein